MVGQEVCQKCEGRGFYRRSKVYPTSIEQTWFSTCTSCGGSGKVDWIQKVIPVKKSKIVLHVLEDFYYKGTGKLVFDIAGKVAMFSYCYEHSKLVEENPAIGKKT